MTPVFGSSPPVLFNGKHRSGGEERFAPESRMMAQRLLQQGYDREYFKREWNVILWGLRLKEKGLKVRVEPLGKVDTMKLEQFLSQAFGQPVAKLELIPTSKCCHTPCKGCMVGNESQRKIWIG